MYCTYVTQVWHPDLPNWQPVPVHVVPTASDSLLMAARCPRQNSLHEELSRLDEDLLAIQESSRWLRGFLANKTGWSEDKPGLVGEGSGLGVGGRWVDFGPFPDRASMADCSILPNRIQTC